MHLTYEIGKLNLRRRSALLEGNDIKIPSRSTGGNVALAQVRTLATHLATLLKDLGKPVPPDLQSLLD